MLGQARSTCSTPGQPARSFPSPHCSCPFCFLSFLLFALQIHPPHLKAALGASPAAAAKPCVWPPGLCPRRPLCPAPVLAICHSYPISALPPELRVGRGLCSQRAAGSSPHPCLLFAQEATWAARVGCRQKNKSLRQFQGQLQR